MQANAAALTECSGWRGRQRRMLPAVGGGEHRRHYRKLPAVTETNGGVPGRHRRQQRVDKVPQLQWQRVPLAASGGGPP